MCENGRRRPGMRTAHQTDSYVFIVMTLLRSCNLEHRHSSVLPNQCDILCKQPLFRYQLVQIVHTSPSQLRTLRLANQRQKCLMNFLGQVARLQAPTSLLESAPGALPRDCSPTKGSHQ
jgi:hypothetical protein